VRNNRRELQSLHTPSESNSEGEGSEDNPSTTSEDDHARRPRQSRSSKQMTLDFTLESPKFEGRLNPNNFIDRMNTVEMVFEYKDILNDKKIKLVALKLA